VSGKVVAQSYEQLETGSFTSSELIECPTTLRVVSWNIARGANLNAIIEFLATANADIIFLQEVDRNARRTNFLNVAKRIAQKLKMNYVFGCEFEELAEGTRASPAYHGQATLSCWPLSGYSILRFHKQSNFWQPRWFTPNFRLLQRRRGGRMALFTNVLVLGRKLAAYNLHCESRGSDNLRYSQLHEFLQHANHLSIDVPVLAAGDFNFDVALSPAAAMIEKMRFLNPFASLHQTTTNLHSLLARGRIIDWILLRGPLKAVDPKVHNSVVASDHYPLSLTVSFL
jgi:endonuclease/exonuclease/phosphatase family metal-dependent hydrolase